MKIDQLYLPLCVFFLGCFVITYFFNIRIREAFTDPPTNNLGNPENLPSPEELEITSPPELPEQDQEQQTPPNVPVQPSDQMYQEPVGLSSEEIAGPLQVAPIEVAPLEQQILQEQCPESNWWNKMPVRQIISKHYGVHIPVEPLEPEKFIDSRLLILQHRSGTNHPTSCMAVNPDGTFSLVKCNKEVSKQHWEIKVIKTKSDFDAVLSMAEKDVQKQPGGFSGKPVNESTPLGFCMVISKEKPGKALQYESGGLSVRTVGNYDGQKWDISPEKAQIAVPTHKIPHGAGYSKELNPLQQLQYQNFNPSAPYESQGQKAMDSVASSTQLSNQGNGGDSSPAFNINVNLSDIDAILGESVNPKPTVESFANSAQPLGTHGGKGCKPCPSVLVEYLRNNQIPCQGCNLNKIYKNQ